MAIPLSAVALDKRNDSRRDGARGDSFGAWADFLYGLRRRHPLTKFGVILFFGSILGVAWSLGWDTLSERFRDAREGIELREAMYKSARRMAADYPWFGTGPGTFEPVFQLYRESPEEYWPAQLHNDWLETRITFGRVGSVLIALAFACALLRWFFPGNAPGSWRVVSPLWVALAGCLMHARFDFPLQMYSILLLFLVLCGVLFSLSRAEE
jgi:O-antigen ligase